MAIKTMSSFFSHHLKEKAGPIFLSSQTKGILLQKGIYFAQDKEKRRKSISEDASKNFKIPFKDESIFRTSLRKKKKTKEEEERPFAKIFFSLSLFVNFFLRSFSDNFSLRTKNRFLRISSTFFVLQN